MNPSRQPLGGAAEGRAGLVEEGFRGKVAR